MPPKNSLNETSEESTNSVKNACCRQVREKGNPTTALRLIQSIWPLFLLLEELQ